MQPFSAIATRVLSGHPARTPSPFQLLERTFRELCRGPRPLALPSRLVHPAIPTTERSRSIPLDHVRAALRAAGPNSQLAHRVWPEILRRAQAPRGHAWLVAAAALAVPSLRRVKARRRWGGLVELADLEQEMLWGFVRELRLVDPSDPAAFHCMRRAADLAAYHLLRQAKQHRRNIVPVDPATLARIEEASTPTSWDTGLLERAIAARVINDADAELIATSRIDKIPVPRIVDGPQSRIRAAYRRRSAAEQRLAQAIRADLI
ncbi:hypothetical protein [Embleya sp. NBC_00896]|uniref:hypothetical protein n=1 Tax=Embleya sp. NBC_00896 TaxID=2975961 RepID=UPI002F908271|nr:hypothetical protein OG928_48410 [Embleya sp. NBC_00896]